MKYQKLYNYNIFYLSIYKKYMKGKHFSKLDF